MPTTPENRVRFNLKNVHYAVYASGSFGTPVDVPGAVALELNPESEMTKFYADGLVFWQANSNNGYSGSLEMARFPDQMLQDIWKVALGGTSKVLTENANTEPAVFALLYQIDGDAENEFYVLYACTGTRPGIGSKTNVKTKEPQTQSIDLSCVPMSDGKIMARTTKDTPTATKTGWFTTVFVESTTPPEDLEDT